MQRLEAERDPPSPSSRVVFTGRADGDRDARSPPACSLAISASYGWQRFVVRVEGRAGPAESSSFSFPFPRPPRAAVARRAHGAFVPVRSCCAGRMSRPGVTGRGEGAGWGGCACCVRGVSPEASLASPSSRAERGELDECACCKETATQRQREFIILPRTKDLM